VPIRTTEELVAGLVEVDSAVSLIPFITAASLLVDYVPSDQLPTTPTDTYEVIERWLSAHFYCMRKPRRETERAGDVMAKYETKIGFNLALSKYGQMAMMLDTTGTLSAMNNERRRPRVVWLGQACDRIIRDVE
jgi:hypothetical protein